MTDKRETLTLNDRSARKEENRTETVRSSETKTRRSKLDAVDDFYVNPAEIPDGFTVEWKRYQIYGQVDTPWLNSMSRDGWEPAQPKDFPSLVGKYHSGSMIFGGQQQDMVLMIRPKQLTDEARYEDKANATQQVRTKMEELGLAKQGEAQRVDSAGRSLVKVNRSFEQIPVGD